MRIHGIHVQGLRAIRDAHNLSFDSRYNAVLAANRESAQALYELFLALLYPETDLPRAEAVADLHGELPPRAALAMRLDAQALRVLLDLSKPRVALGRFDPVERSYRPVATRLPEIAAALRTAGRPERSSFGVLCVVPLEAQDGSFEEVRGEDREACEARWLELRAARHRIRVLEREARKLDAELAGRAPLEEALESMPDGVRRFRAFTEERERELTNLELERGALLEERSRIRALPNAQRPVIALGIALAVAAALAGWLAHAALLAAIPVGLAAACAAIYAAWRARRRVGRIDARLGALRMREASLERRFESEVTDVRSLMQALGIDSVDALEAEANALRERLARRGPLGAELREARERFPDEAGDELAALDDALLRVERIARSDRPPGEDPLALRLDAVTRAGMIASEALESRLRVIAPLYLRALTQGQVQGFARELPGFALECRERPEPLLASALEPALRTRVLLAFELALAESLSPGVRAPLVVSPAAAPEREEDARAFARALLRLSSGRQIVQFAPAVEAFAEQATRVHLVA